MPGAVVGKGAAMNLPQEGSAISTSAPYCVLCVDDEASGLTIRQLILEQQGYLVSRAGTVADALALFKSRDFDLVITDHLLGRETGTAMAEEMKRLKPTTPIILLSGTTDTLDGIETVDAFIIKGQGVEILLAKVEELAIRFRANCQEARFLSKKPVTLRAS
jgi:DNA-binding response OmpR family regulator